MERSSTWSEQHQHEQWFGEINQHVPLLYRFVHQELSQYESFGELAHGELDAKDIADSVLLEAQQELSANPDRYLSRSWLLQLALKKIGTEISRIKRERDIPHVDEDISGPLGEPAEPASPLDQGFQIYLEPEYLKLVDVIADVKVPTPEREAEVHEAWECMSRIVKGMRAEWRQVLTLHYAEGLKVDELAETINRPVADTQQLLDEAKRELRRKLAEAGCELRNEDHAH